MQGYGDGSKYVRALVDRGYTVRRDENVLLDVAVFDDGRDDAIGYFVAWNTDLWSVHPGTTTTMTTTVAVGGGNCTTRQRGRTDGSCSLLDDKPSFREWVFPDMGSFKYVPYACWFVVRVGGLWESGVVVWLR